MKQMTVRVSDDTYAQLEQDARMLGIGPAVLARAYLKMIAERRTDFIQVVEFIDGQTQTTFKLDEADLAQ